MRRRREEEQKEQELRECMKEKKTHYCAFLKHRTSGKKKKCKIERRNDKNEVERKEGGKHMKCKKFVIVVFLEQEQGCN